MMKKITINSFIILIIAIVVSCKKDKPPIGMYIGSFNGSYLEGDSIIYQDRQEYLFIIESFKESITMALGPSGKRFTLVKGKNKSIYGVIDITHRSGGGPVYGLHPINIDGHWEKSGSTYYIKGDFSYIYRIIHDGPDDPWPVIVDNYTVNGDFEIRSENLEYFDD